ncbi:mitotic-spindle organizing protein 1 [Limosa lapponica baueri]|uniref:Mitotic-spindle organizing protein 1 n=1 Tax=Limosa lapponica baueri TaxID=1758121 RepID=A0A2I0TXS7_LIMLA|nr:mitotic-spindle organizing protein 1 [Limosa lapponica baueri]
MGGMMYRIKDKAGLATEGGDYKTPDILCKSFKNVLLVHFSRTLSVSGVQKHIILIAYLSHNCALIFSIAVLFEISRILNTGLDMETLSICVRLCEQGINPEALSSVIKELRKATEALKAAENMTG